MQADPNPQIQIARVKAFQYAQCGGKCIVNALEVGKGAIADELEHSTAVLPDERSNNVFLQGLYSAQSAQFIAVHHRREPNDVQRQDGS